MTAGRQITAFTLTEASGGSGEYDYVVTGLPDNLQFSETERTISGTPDAATVAIVTYTASDAVLNNSVIEPAEQTFAITVAATSAGNTNDFVTTWRTTSDNERITIPTFTGEAYDYTVDWGDGRPNSVNQTGSATHTYTSANDYMVRISGRFPRIYFNNEGGIGSNREKIIAVDQWGDQAWTSMNRAFHGASNLAGQAIDTPVLTDVINMRSMFAGASAFNQNIGDWDVSNITNMRSMFAGASAFNQNIGDWDVGNITNMRSMFSGASAFNQNIGGWNVSNVTNMESMFSGASAFNQDIGGWNVSNVTNMESTFYLAASFNQNIGAWDVTSVTLYEPYVSRCQRLQWAYWRLECEQCYQYEVHV